MAVVGFAAHATAEEFRVPALTGPVVDDAGVIDASTRSVLEGGIRALRASPQSGTQITVLTVPSLGGLEVEQASIKVTDAWKLGGAKDDKGVLLLIAPTEHKVRIEVGQGLEGVLTDAYSNRIIQNVILPYFRKGDFAGGALQGVAAIVHYTDPNVDASQLFSGASAYDERDARSAGGRRGGFPILYFLGFILLMMVLGGRGGGGGRGSRLGAAALGFGLGSLGGRGGGGWGGGGGGGGGWSGGGGGFSGGGASGGW